MGSGRDLGLRRRPRWAPTTGVPPPLRRHLERERRPWPAAVAALERRECQNAGATLDAGPGAVAPPGHGLTPDLAGGGRIRPRRRSIWRSPSGRAPAAGRPGCPVRPAGRLPRAACGPAPPRRTAATRRRRPPRRRRSRCATPRWAAGRRSASGPREGREVHRRRPHRDGGARQGGAAEGEARPLVVVVTPPARLGALQHPEVVVVVTRRGAAGSSRSRRGSPAPGARRALERPDDLVGDPAPVEVALLARTRSSPTKHASIRPG